MNKEQLSEILYYAHWVRPKDNWKKEPETVKEQYYSMAIPALAALRKEIEGLKKTPCPQLLPSKHLPKGKDLNYKWACVGYLEALSDVLALLGGEGK